MNIVRKLRNTVSGASSSVESSIAANNTPLGLMHLKKLFLEYLHPSHVLSEQEKADKLYNMLPLFCKVFSTSTNDIHDKFWDISTFCQHISKLMVYEIRIRASKPTTKEASSLIVKFLEIENCEESSNGWMLLTTLNILAAENGSFIQIMTEASVPSTLVRCLYLFFDLSDHTITERKMKRDEFVMSVDIDGKNSTEFTPIERRILLQKIFFQLLIRLCSHRAPVEELVLKDDLSLLFSSITTVANSTQIVLWRKGATEVLMTISRHNLTPLVINYIHNKSCISGALENMKKTSNLSSSDLIEMTSTLFCLLKDSSEVSPILLDDFRLSHGYLFLTESLLKLVNSSTQNEDSIKNLIVMVTSLCMCGCVSLYPAPINIGCGSIFQIKQFVLPQPTGKGASVRNIHAFLILQNAFLKSSSSFLSSTILEAISTIYHSDNANYFILEPQNTLSQFIERIHCKVPDCQLQLFKLVEYIVFELNYVPCKELISMSIFLKTHSVPYVNSSILCMQSLLRILNYDIVFKNVYREVGILEVFITCLKRYTTTFLPRSSVENSQYQQQKQLIILVIDAIATLLNGNSANATLYREYTASTKNIHLLIMNSETRSFSLKLLRELLLVNASGTDDDLLQLIANLNAIPPNVLDIRLDIILLLRNCLKESHRLRTIFRKTNGYSFLMNTLTVAYEEFHINQQILDLITLVFETLAISMRYEPANAQFFYRNLCKSSKFFDSIRQIECFSTNYESRIEDCEQFVISDELQFKIHQVFTKSTSDETIRKDDQIESNLYQAITIYRLLYNLALDSFEKWNFVSQMNIRSNNCSQQMQDQRSSRANLLNIITTLMPDPAIIHGGVVVVMLQLIACIKKFNVDMNTLWNVQLYLSEVLKSLLRSERNQQIMCDKDFVHVLLQFGSIPLTNEAHILHPPFQYMLERLAAQAIEPNDLRTYLRLGDPLCCIPLDIPSSKHCTTIPLTRIKSLVSMTTPKDVPSTFMVPPFIEFDMSFEGFGCLFLPSIAPSINSSSSTINTSGCSIIPSTDATIPTILQRANLFCSGGGIGSGGDRLFPPQTGLTYSTWICIEKISDPPCIVRLLNVIRSDCICFSINLLPNDQALYISTQECLSNVEPDTTQLGVKICSPNLQREGQWHHIVVVLNRAVLKNSTLTIYINGRQIFTQRTNYICQTADANCTIYAYIGTPPIWRHISILCWRQGPCHLVEEVFSSTVIAKLFQLGPNYLGPLSTTVMELINNEEKVIFGLNAKAVTYLTLNKIRKVYSRNDTKSIAKHLGISSHDSSTPIWILHNSGGHLPGPARTLGGIGIGYLGVRVFCPNTIASTINSIGGASIFLGLIAQATNIESLYASTKALSCIVRSNKIQQEEMDRKHGYQTLAMLLRRKNHLLNSHILHLIFTLVGTVDSGRESSTIPNTIAFNDLLCDLDIWQQANGDLIRTLLEHFYDLVTESNEKRNNIWIMRDLDLVEKLLAITSDIKHSTTEEILFSLLSLLLGPQPRRIDLLHLGHFLISTIPITKMCEQDHQSAMRNRYFALLHSLLFLSKSTVAEDIVTVLGFDWIMCFMQHYLHSSTIIWSVRILVILCGNPNLLAKFRDGIGTSGWLRSINITVNENLIPHHMSLLLLEHNQKQEKLNTSVHIHGFHLLSWLLTKHFSTFELYYLLSAMIMGQPVKTVPMEKEFNLDNVWSFIWNRTVTSQPINTIINNITVCPEAIIILLQMIRYIINSNQSELDEHLKQYPIAIVQTLFQFYQNVHKFISIFMTTDLINGLMMILFPIRQDTLSPTSTVQLLPSYSNELIQHPIRQYIIDFLRVIIVDSLSLPQMIGTKTQPPVIDLVLEEDTNSTIQEQAHFQTEILTTVMEHILIADMLIGDQAAIPMVPLPNANVQNVAPNVSYVTARIVDKLWQGCLTKDPHEVFDFIIQLIGQTRRSKNQSTLECLYHCFNRCILFLLSRTTETIADQMSVLEILHKLITNRLIVFGAGNHELEFIGCLTYCLLQLIADMKVNLEFSMKTTWHVNPSSDVESRDDHLTSLQGRNLMAGAALRVWEELYVCKKPAIEEVFKITLIPCVGNEKAPNLLQIRDQLFDPASKIWLNYVDTERKTVYSQYPWEIHHHIQSKIHKVTGGLTRLASRGKIRRDEHGKVRTTNSNKSEILNWIESNVEMVRNAVELNRKQCENTKQHTQRYVYHEWLETENELIRERGLWGPVTSCYLDKWMLDVTEGPHRMRKRTIKNEFFYLHYPYIPDCDKGLLKYKVATSSHSKLYYQAMKSKGYTIESPELRSISIVEDVVTTPFNLSSTRLRSRSDPSEEEFDNDEDHHDQSLPPPSDNQTLMRLLEPNEKIIYMFRCARIQGLDTAEGLLLFGQEHCYIVDGFTIIKNREIRDIDNVSLEEYESILPNNTPSSTKQQYHYNESSTFTMERQCVRFLYDDIREVHKRRYLLQPMALEVFSSDGRNCLLAFPRKIRNKIYQRFMAVATGIADSAQHSVAGQKRTANVEQTTNILSSLIGDTSVTQRWVRGEISNFQYLMHLNTLAGRSYNDLMQYPVFPWILNDYDSSELDLSKPTTFRNFQRPMGAQTIERLQQFEKRFNEWDDPHSETPPYHYATHYSSAMIVCSYLVRIEPFTQHFLRLQGRHFDLADRMFHSIKEAWLSASKHNMADVKELIPEFFYLPEFLENDNHFDLGAKQSGIVLDHVVLPPWAKQNTREFIRVHRLALECDYVSQNLHHWIDLIFGYKQTGQSAIDAINVFHHWFYEGNVDIYNIDDPLKKTATIEFINNFGQIPKQLFKRPHPSKKINGTHSMIGNRLSLIDTGAISHVFNLPQPNRFFFHHLDNLKPSVHPLKELTGPVGQILYQDRNMLLAVEQNKILIPPLYNKYVSWGFADHSLRIGIYDSDKIIFISEYLRQCRGEILTCCCPSDKLIVTAGTSTVVTIWEYETEKRCLTLKYNLYGHTKAVTCLATSQMYNIIVSGSRDGSVIIWDISRAVFIRQLHKYNHSPISAIAVNNLTGEIATCASTWLHLWSINGVHLASVDTSVGRSDHSLQQILCVTFSEINEWDAQNVIITGSTDGVTRMWSIDYVQIPIICDSIKCPNQTPLLEEKQHNVPVTINKKRNLAVDDIKETTTRDQLGDELDISSGTLRASKSETNLNDSYINQSSTKGNSNPLNILRPGFQWDRQLVFCSKLTMHTAYDRKDNAEPASITALAISKDHRTVYIGDTRGRIFSWSVSDIIGKVSDHWLKDNGTENCRSCNFRFTLYERKHHCRNCGHIFCSKCSRFETEISRLRIFKPVRVCQACYSNLKLDR